MTTPGYPPKAVNFAVDGIAISADGKHAVLLPHQRHQALRRVDRCAAGPDAKSDAQVAATVRIVTGKMPSDGLESDAAGNVYLSDPVTDSIHRWNPATGLAETIVHDPRLLWPDTMSVANDGYLYVNANQLNRQPTMHNGVDQRIKPYTLFRVRINAQPVLLK